MQRRPKAQIEEQPPNVTLVVLTSLFGYPGAGHLLVSAKMWAALFALAFTLGTVAAISEVWYLVPELAKMYQGEAATITRYPNVARLGTWLLITGLAWAGSGVHSGVLAHRFGKSFVPSTGGDSLAAVEESRPTEGSDTESQA